MYVCITKKMTKLGTWHFYLCRSEFITSLFGNKMSSFGMSTQLQNDKTSTQPQIGQSCD